MTVRQAERQTADPTTINEFFNALQRLFRIGIYYPSGHATLDKATDRFLKLLKMLAAERPDVTIALIGDSLQIAELTISDELPFLKEFKSLLSGLSVNSISFSRDMTAEESHVFVRKILQIRSQAMQARSFNQIEITELPLSVTVRCKEFLARKGASISDERSGESAESLNDFVESLAKFGLSGDEISHCKQLLDSLPERLSGSTMNLADLPYASWDDVARLLARTIKGREQEGTAKSADTIHNNINALASILKKLQRETTDTSSREAINLLVSIIRKPLDSTLPFDDDHHVQRIFPDKPHFSAQAIQEFTTRNRLHPKILKNIPESSPHQETLSIVLQLAKYEQSLPNQVKMQQFTREILSAPIAEKSWALLSGGLHHLLVESTEARLAAAIRLLVDPLRRSIHASSINLLLLTARLCNQKEGKRLWPYVVNELLVCGSGADERGFASLCMFASRFPATDMILGLEQLKGLEAFQNSSIAPDIFPGLPAECYPLFALLLKTEIESYVGERILGGLRRKAPDWLMKATVHLLDLSKQEHKLFLYAYLRQAPEKTLPPVLKQTAAKIMADGLATLTQDKRGQSWVPETITALAHLPKEQTKSILEQIASEKKLLFIPEWPSDCRKAAQLALSGQRRNR